MYPWASPYFFVYFTAGVVVIFNLINTIIIEMYTSTLNEKSIDAIKYQEEQDKRIAEMLTSKEVMKRVLKQWGSTVATLQNVKLHRIDKKATRQKLSSDSQAPVSLKELKKCQKYAQVNLVELYMDKYEGEGQIITVQNDLARMIIESKKYSVQKFNDGDYIIHQGEIGSVCYLIQQGICKIYANAVEVSTKKEGDLFGEIGLLSDAVRSADVVAIGNVECYSFSRQTFLTEFDQEVVVNLAEKIGSIVATYNKHAINRARLGSEQNAMNAKYSFRKRTKSILV